MLARNTPMVSENCCTLLPRKKLLAVPMSN